MTFDDFTAFSMASLGRLLWKATKTVAHEKVLKPAVMNIRAWVGGPVIFSMNESLGESGRHIILGAYGFLVRLGAWDACRIHIFPNLLSGDTGNVILGPVYIYTMIQLVLFFKEPYLANVI